MNLHLASFITYLVANLSVTVSLTIAIDLYTNASNIIFYLTEIVGVLCNLVSQLILNYIFWMYSTPIVEDIVIKNLTTTARVMST